MKAEAKSSQCKILGRRRDRRKNFFPGKAKEKKNISLSEIEPLGIMIILLDIFRFFLRFLTQSAKWRKDIYVAQWFPWEQSNCFLHSVVAAALAVSELLTFGVFLFAGEGESF